MNSHTPEQPAPNSPQTPSGVVCSDQASLAAPSGSANDRDDVIKLFVVEYEYRNRQWSTVVEARTIEAAKRQFRRDNPDVELLTCY